MKTDVETVVNCESFVNPYTPKLTSVCIFSILFSIYLLWNKQEEFFKQSSASLAIVTIVTLMFDSG